MRDPVRRRYGSPKRNAISSGGTVAKPSKTLSSEYDPERDVLLHYEPNDPKMKPKGFSGGAVWRERVGSGGVWTADPVIFGLQTSWFSTSRLLQVLGAPYDQKLP